MLKKRAFAFFSTDDRSCYQPRTLLRARYGKPGTDECICYASAEIQLGGVDPASITGEMQLTTTIQPNDYAIPVSLPGAHVHFLSQQINEEQKKRLSSDMGVFLFSFFFSAGPFGAFRRCGAPPVLEPQPQGSHRLPGPLQTLATCRTRVYLKTCEPCF